MADNDKNYKFAILGIVAIVAIVACFTLISNKGTAASQQESIVGSAMISPNYELALYQTCLWADEFRLYRRDQVTDDVQKIQIFYEQANCDFVIAYYGSYFR